MIEELLDDLVKEYKLLYYWAKRGKGSAKRKLAKVKAKIAKKAKASLVEVKKAKGKKVIPYTNYVDRILKEVYSPQDDEIEKYLADFTGDLLPRGAEIPCDGCCGVFKRGAMVIADDPYSPGDDIILCLDCYKISAKLR